MSDKKESPPLHPGSYIKHSIIPKGLSVKEAAEMLGVGRPALSNLLNENAALSPEMAARIEKAFGVESAELLEMQAHFDSHQMREHKKVIAVRTYTPSFLDIHAGQIEAWADKIEARSVLPALLRRLVNTTGQNLSRVDFPAYDNAERHGWDGQVETDSATPWIPLGKSGWEFGVSQNPSTKADDDYIARVASVPLSERQETTFVFVTPRNWPTKNDWAKIKRESGEWKDVKAYDASDLEQWLEQSIPTQSWFAEELGISDNDLLSLDQCWHKWASVTDPELNKELFSGSSETHKKRLEEWLSKPPERPFILAADSDNEALAFLSCAFEAIGSSPFEYYDQAVAICSADALKKVARGYSKFVAIITSPEGEEALSGLQKRLHTVIVRHKGSIQGEPDISLDIPNYETFKRSLISMGINEQEIERYSRESGQSPTILRRRLSQVQAIKFPPWTQDGHIVRKLIPLILVGVWDSTKKADQEILSYLSGGSLYGAIEEAVADILKLEESPLLSIGDYRGIISKIDALFAVNGSVTREELGKFFDTAGVALCEDDPALDLPEDKRWAAAIYEKTRDHSAALRDALCETLVLLSVHGNNLFQERLGINVESKVNFLIHGLLKPFDPRTWLSQQNDLPRYAEAAPNEFLDILEEDLNSDNPQILALLKPVESGIFGAGCPRTGLLWALELLAWKPERLVRVISILARLAKTQIDDNWLNKPENSLQCIFRSWMPQTAANVEDRKAALKFVANNFPSIGWRLCIEQFDPAPRVGHYSYRPRWRNDAAGAGQPVTYVEINEFEKMALNIAIDWPHHDENTLGDLVARLQRMPEEDIKRVWKHISDWNAEGPSDLQKATLRERVRRYAFTRRGRKNLNKATRDYAREAYELMTPEDPVIRHQWLFAQHWVEESADELEEEDFDFTKREERIGQQRAEVLREIWDVKNLSGVKQLLTMSDAASSLGWHLAKDVVENTVASDLVHQLVSDCSGELEFKLNDCIAGFLNAQDAHNRSDLINELIQRFKQGKDKRDDKIIRLLKCAPFHSETWKHVEKLPKKLQRRYWCEVHPRWSGQEAPELKELIDRLLEVGRPRAAFSVAHVKWEEIESEQLTRLLHEVPVNGNEPAGHYQISSYQVTGAFETLQGRADVSKEELARLEFLYIEVLGRSDHGIPNLEKQVSTSPQLFIQALALAYKRSDNGEDPPEWSGSNTNDRQKLALAAHSLLQSVKRLPGTQDNGKIDVAELRQWLADARSLCLQYAREKIGDQVIGELLSISPVGEDGIWPCEPVRQALEDIASKDIAIGMSVGVYNSRGPTWRGEGGEQERELAEKYRNWSRQLAFEYPYVSKLVEQIARSYDYDAKRWDTEESIRKRIGYY